ncbi:MAG: yveL [Actinomycetia bacterium]|nr:yveL [Actinomycetes bacterium]
MLRFNRWRESAYVPGVSRARATQLNTANEAFRVLRSNLLVATGELDHPVVVVTSAFPKEGKTSTCVSLAESFAATGARVVLVDLDLRDPDSHRLLGTHNEIGVSDVLLDQRTFEDCIQWLEVGVTKHASPAGMYFLAAGPKVASPTELLSTPRTAKLLEGLAAEADIVLLDAPPVLSVADTLVIGRLAAGAVLVIEAGRTPVPAAKRAKDALTRNQTRLLGVVLNKFKSRLAHSEPGSGDVGYGFGYGGVE